MHNEDFTKNTYDEYYDKKFNSSLKRILLNFKQAAVRVFVNGIFYIIHFYDMSK
jgi:hypothetical protein